jgi:two-component system, OmpR family, alkaline phosphatase synthesis response regulator PhoP
MAKTPRILIVDDDPDIVELLEYNLQKDGYEVLSASDGEAGLDLAQIFKPDLILLDIMMPKLNGIEAASRIRKVPELKNVLILFLTARSEEYSEVAAFKVGADDYIVKPIKPQALLGRLKALLRRDAQSNSAENEAIITVGDLTINPVNHLVNIGEKALSLPKKEFELLLFLAKNPNKVFSRDEILNKIWGVDVYVVERTIDVHIRKVREKIGENYIQTLKGIGYMFVKN